MIPEPLIPTPTLEEQIASAAAELDRVYESLRWHPMSSAPQDSFPFEAYDMNGTHIHARWSEADSVFVNGSGVALGTPLACWRSYCYPPSSETLAFLTAKNSDGPTQQEEIDRHIESHERAEHIRGHGKPGSEQSGGGGERWLTLSIYESTCSDESSGRA